MQKFRLKFGQATFCDFSFQDKFPKDHLWCYGPLIFYYWLVLVDSCDVLTIEHMGIFFNLI